MTAGSGRIWIAVADSTTGIELLELRFASDAPTAPAIAPVSASNCRLVGRFAGHEPRLAALQDDRLVLVLRERRPGAGEVLVSRGVTPEASDWRPPGVVTSRRLDGLEACGRLLVTPRGTLVLPTLWAAAQPDSHVVLSFLSQDGGASWSDGTRLADARHVEPIAAALGDARTTLVFGSSKALVARESSDDLMTTGPTFRLPIADEATSYRILRTTAGLVVVWTQSVADSAFAPPSVPSLRCAFSRDDGASWQRSGALPMRPGCSLNLRAGVIHDDAFAFLLDEGCGARRSFACVGWDPDVGRSARRAPVASCYTPDAEATRLALQVLATHTLERPTRSPRLFVEGYYMRALVAAAGAMAGEDPSGFAWFAPELAVQRATDWADSLVAVQAWNGFWKLGYQAEWYADMAAAVCLFPALEAHVDTARAGRYERSAARFLRGLERENMVFENGAVGIGRSFTIGPNRRMARPQHEPYLVSTALAGIAVPAWLFARTGNPVYRERALAALEYTLSQVTEDGFLEPAARREGSLRVAAYVEEGWMAADAFLGDPNVRARLHAALLPHVAWLLRTQRHDGTWDGGEEGGFARTPAIVDFLIWYDQAGAPREDVRGAVRRASVAFVDPDHWRAWGLFRADEDHEVLRALAGRPLAALVSGRPVQ